MGERRGHGEGGIYQRADGTWCAALDLGKDDMGKRRRKVLYGRTRTEARAKLLKAQHEHDERRLAIASPTVKVWMDYWFTEIAPGRTRLSTRNTYRSYIDKYIVPTLGHHRLDRLDASHVRRLYAQMRAEGRSDATVRQVHAILARALLCAKREDKVPVHILERSRFDAPKPGDNPRTPLTLDQARKVLKAAAGDPYESRWYAALYLGLRQGEALGLTWDCVDLLRGTVTVRQALQRVKGRGLIMVEPKSKHSMRTLPVPPVVLSRLKVARAASRTPGGLVWTTDGRPIDPSRDAKRWSGLLEAAGVPHVALHAARNTAATLLAATGVDPKFASEILGHGDVKVTQRHYQHGDLEMHRAALLALEAYIEE